jgi:hypothetical protein
LTNTEFNGYGKERIGETMLNRNVRRFASVAIVVLVLLYALVQCVDASMGYQKGVQRAVGSSPYPSPSPILSSLPAACGATKPYAAAFPCEWHTALVSALTLDAETDVYLERVSIEYVYSHLDGRGVYTVIVADDTLDDTGVYVGQGTTQAIAVKRLADNHKYLTSDNE